jgi:urease accessory protein
MRALKSVVTILVFSLYATAACAHEGGGLSGDFYSGFIHPLLGWDHVFAMVAVGLWAAFLGKPAVWILPLVFLLVMTIGGVLGLSGVAVPSVDMGISVSLLVFGAMVAVAARPSARIVALLAGAFAIFHGYAHGVDLPGTASPVTYTMGFVTATGLLYISGTAIGLLVRSPAGRLAVQAGGGVIALAGAGFLAYVA